MASKIQSWEVSDAFWDIAEPHIPKPKRDTSKSYMRKAGGGRRPLSSRRVFEAIVFVLRTGIQWKALPKNIYGSPSSIHKYFLLWAEAGFFQELWRRGLAEYDELMGIAWEWQSIDGGMYKAPLAREADGTSLQKGQNREIYVSNHLKSYRANCSKCRKETFCSQV